MRGLGSQSSGNTLDVSSLSGDDQGVRGLGSQTVKNAKQARTERWRGKTLKLTLKPKIVGGTPLIHLPQIETDNLNQSNMALIHLPKIVTDNLNQLNMLIKDEAPGNIDVLLLILKITDRK